MRQTARELGFALATVQRYLGEDPHRLRSLRSALEEERALKWAQLEHRGLDAALDGCGHVAEILGKRRKGWRDTDRHNLMVVSRTLAALRLASDTASKQVQLLTGGATERTAAIGMTAEERVAAMDELMLYEELRGREAGVLIPPGMRERLERPSETDEQSPPPKAIPEKKRRKKTSGVKYAGEKKSAKSLKKKGTR